MTHRRLIGAVAALALVLSAGASAGPRDEAQPTVTATTFAISGRGWGHRVGMSQYGALGFAQHGYTYDRILAWYYRGAQLGPAPIARIRVLLAEGKRRLTIASAVDFHVRDGTGATHTLAAGSYTFGPRLNLTVDGADAPQALPGPLRFLPGRTPLELGRPYRGSIEVRVAGPVLHAINIVGLESYVRGVVSDEMPRTWPLEAVKAQAVAARSYALSQRRTGQSFDVYADVRDQVYGGIEAETPVGDEASTATKGQVLLYDGEVATAYYFSTSGGRTVSFSDFRPDEQPLPYLVSVADPYDAISPYHEWGPVVVGGAKLARVLGVRGAVDLRSTPSPGRAREVVVLGRNGEVALPATTVRAALGLRSTWFRAVVLSLSRPAGPVAAGAEVTLSGVVRRLRQVALEERPASGSWQAGAPVAPASDGTFSVVVTPTETMQYRLSAGDLKSAVLRVPVEAPIVES